MGRVVRFFKDLLGYCYYRITRFYVNSKFKGYRFYTTRVCGGLTFILWSVLFIAVVLCPLSAIIKVNLITYKLFLFDQNTPVLWTIIIFAVLGDFYGSKERYNALCLKYAGDPKEKIRGCGVVGFVFLSFALLGLSMWLFERPLDVAIHL